ncbi:ribonucleotide reductase subunit alpha [Aquabacterium sp.]|uniref:ribonucleotide reductase subunit alpha n=1 Tax=Aquabacterium sp. TaxID=1872578 RepID=UPI002488888A|nr:ribonucleotide reductase subunit alpha [Aquabacterium sp.]MDI1261351.1 ribonucleotide reductase subunit alpha [Aquabacterium sp.]
MSITTFNQLLQAARQQPDAQRLLLVFAGAGLPEGCTPEQRAAFEAGHGGELTPLACVDKTPDELGSFAQLTQEAEQMVQDWAIVFVAGMSGKGQVPPTSAEAQPQLQRMVDAIKGGQLGTLIPFNREGEAVRLG